ncbi:MAG: helix-turn-helix domain-containing protein [Bacilli bacterium]
MNEKVLEILKENKEPMKAGEVTEKLGVDKKDIDKAIKSLVKEDLVESPKRCFYSAK